MKRILSLISLAGLFLIASCFNPPEYSDVPSIDFENVRTKVVPGPTTPDSLFVTISFRDGDGDLGGSGTENSPPFNPKWYFLLEPGPTCEKTVTPPCKKISFVDASNLANVVRYSTKRTNSDYDTLPAYVKPFICNNYEILRDDQGQIIDTVYIQRNSRTFNYFCDLYINEGAGFVKYDWSLLGTGCPLPGGGFYGRFDVLGKDGNPDLGLPIEGTLTFRFGSSSLFSTLKSKSLQLKIKILDRSGNYSNEVMSDPFSLN